MLDFIDSPGAPEAALWCAVLWCAWEDLQHPNARIRRDAGAFFASPDFDRIAALAQLDTCNGLQSKHVGPAISAFFGPN